MSDIKTETHEYTETKSDDWNSDVMWLLILFTLFYGFGGNTTNIALEKEVAELKGKVDVIERLVTK